MPRLLTCALCAAASALVAPPPRITRAPPRRAMGLAGPVDPVKAAAAAAGATIQGDVRKAAIFGALFLSSALLHAAEVSITTLYPWKVKEFAEGEETGGVFTMLDRDITRVLSTVLIVTTVCNILSTAIFTEMVARRSRGSLRFISLATSGLTAATLFFGELIPKTIGVNNAERTARLLCPSVGLLTRVIGPFGLKFAQLSKWVLRTCRLIDDDDSAEEVSEDEVRMVVGGASASGGLDTESGAMIGGVLDLQQRRVSEIMRPRVDVNALEKNSTSRELLHLVDETGHSRIPVYDDEIDRVVGVVNAKQLFRFLEQTAKPEDLDSVVLSSFIEPTYFVPETMAAWKVLEEMRRRRLHMAIVVDEHGGTAGVVTLEDILETVVGEIYDEDDEAEILLGDEVILNEDGSYDILGNANVDDVVAALALRDAEGNKPCDIMDVTTAAGFLCFHAGEIPAQDDHVIVHDHDFVVLESDERRVLRIRATPLNAQGVLEPLKLPDLCANVENVTVLSREEPVAAR